MHWTTTLQIQQKKPSPKWQHGLGTLELDIADKVQVSKASPPPPLPNLFPVFHLFNCFIRISSYSSESDTVGLFMWWCRKLYGKIEQYILKPLFVLLTAICHSMEACLLAPCHSLINCKDNSHNCVFLHIFWLLFRSKSQWKSVVNNCRKIYVETPETNSGSSVEHSTIYVSPKHTKIGLQISSDLISAKQSYSSQCLSSM